MKEQLIEFETAKLAKEKGFDFRSGYYYTEKGHLIHTDSIHILDVEKHGRILLPANTQSLLQKWLREIHNFHFTIKCKGKYFGYGWHPIHKKFFEFHSGQFETYEQALEKGLQEALKLIN